MRTTRDEHEEEEDSLVAIVHAVHVHGGALDTQGRKSRRRRGLVLMRVLVRTRLDGSSMQLHRRVLSLGEFREMFLGDVPEALWGLCHWLLLWLGVSIGLG